MTKRMGMKGVFQKKVSLKRGGQGFSGMQIGTDCFRKCVLRRWVTFGQGFSGMQTGTVSENASLEDERRLVRASMVCTQEGTVSEKVSRKEEQCP